jgi:uncharacterized repeat protein (TIGR01451 family)
MEQFRPEAVLPTADLALAMTDTPDPVPPGGTVAYSLTASNAGPNSADGVTVTSLLPTEATFVSAASCSHSGEPNGGTVTCSLGTVGSGGSELRTILVTAPTAPGILSLTNSATVTTSSDDPDSGNDSAVAVTGVEQNVDLTVTSLTAPSSGPLGGTIAVSAGILNQGNADAGSFRLGIYFSTDSTITTGDVFSGFSCAVSSLAAGGADTCNGSAPVPITLTPGNYYVGAIVDDLSQVSESDELDNTRSADTGTVAVVVPAAPAPVAVWSFDESATAVGTVLTDGSGNAHHAVTQGAATSPVFGVSSSGRGFGGYPAYAETTAHPNLSTSDFSFSTWVKLDSYPSSWGVIYSNYGGDFQGWLLGAYQDGRVIFSVMGLPSSGLWALSNTTLTTGQWHHVAVTFNGSARRGSIYIDGTLDRIVTFPGWTPQTSVNPTFAKASWYGGAYLACKLDEAKLFTSELLSQQLATEFASYSIPSVPDPVASWGFDDSGTLPGTTLTDSSGNGHHALAAGIASLLTNGVDGGARAFSGFPNHATLSPHADLSTSSFSFSTWIRVDAMPSSWGVIYSNYGGDSQGWYTGVYNDGRVILAITGLPNYGAWLLSNGSLTAGQWHHVAVTFDGTSRLGSIYIDGTLDRNLTFPGWTPQTVTQPTFARASWYSGAHLEAGFDEAKLYTEMIPAGAIVEDYSSYTPPAVPVPVAAWSFDDAGSAPGTPLSDESGNGHTAVTAGLTVYVAGERRVRQRATLHRHAELGQCGDAP